MSYAAWSVVAFEVPTAAKWNILGTNDASFNDGTGIGDDKILERHILDGVINNAKLNTTEGEIGGVETNWVPTFSNFTKGNATIVAKKIKIGKLVHWSIKVTLGSTSSVSGVIGFTLPSSFASNIYDQYQHMGLSGIFDATFGLYDSRLIPSSTTGVQLFGTGATAPMTWAVNDRFFAAGTYKEAA